MNKAVNVNSTPRAIRPDVRLKAASGQFSCGYRISACPKQEGIDTGAVLTKHARTAIISVLVCGGPSPTGQDDTHCGLPPRELRGAKFVRRHEEFSGEIAFR